MYDNKRLISILILTAIIFSFFTIDIYSNNSPAVGAKAAALYEPESKQFLYLKNGNARLPMASTTKIMTAIVALEHIDKDEYIEADERAVGTEGSSIYLEKGEVMRAEDLIYALMLSSANDAAAALAYKISGSIDAFSRLMNEKAAAIGLSNTNFQNPHGLDSEDHYTTARDLALIAAYALNDPTFREISATYKRTVESSLRTRILVNHNKLLKSYEGCIGVKTGYTKKSGRSLVSAAERSGLSMIAVTINDPDDWRDHKLMLDYGFSSLEKYPLLEKGRYRRGLPVIGTESKVSIINKNEFKPILKAGIVDFDIEIRLSRYPAAPIRQGDVLGSMIFTHKGKIIGEIPLIAENDVNTEKKRSSLLFQKEI